MADHGLNVVTAAAVPQTHTQAQAQAQPQIQAHTHKGPHALVPQHTGPNSHTHTHTHNIPLPAHKRYTMGRTLGNGSFGVVCEATCCETGELVAVKKVLQDPRFKNRELDVMQELAHTNVVQLRDFFYTENSDKEEKYLHVVMDFVPDNVYTFLKSFTKTSKHMPLFLVKLYVYQICRSLGYLHSVGICHRDVKPQNLLVDPESHHLKLCDFGSAKRLLPNENSVAYICSRFYRAPELMLGATQYTTAIDVWSIGCVMGELLLGKPLFPGESSVDQLVKIIHHLGTPTKTQMKAMNPNYTEFVFPSMKPKSWKRLFGSHVTEDSIDLLGALLQYDPVARISPYEALAMPFFDELREAECLPGNINPMMLFDWTELELQQMSPETQEKVIPEWMKNPQYSV